MCFRGKTAALQVVVGEFRMACHWHGGRPKGTDCCKCRPFKEMSRLLRPCLLPHKTEDRMLWYSMSDMESEEYKGIVETVKRSREAEWAKRNVTRLPAGKGWRRSARVENQRAANTAQADPPVDEDIAEGVQDASVTEPDNGADSAEDCQPVNVSPEIVQGLQTATQSLTAVLAQLTPRKKKRRTRQRRR